MNISKLQADIQLKQDILNFLNEGGAVKVCKASKPRKEEMVFSSKGAVFTKGRMKARFSGYSSVDERIA